MPPGKSWREVKNENWGNIFDGKFPRDAWHRMQQFCMLQQPKFFPLASLADYSFLLSRLYLRGRVSRFNRPCNV